MLVRYALRALVGVDRLAVTLADADAPWRACRAWAVDAKNEVDALDPCSMTSERNARYTEMALSARPLFVQGPPLDTIASLLDQNVAIVARGPTAADVTSVHSMSWSSRPRGPAWG